MLGAISDDQILDHCKTEQPNHFQRLLQSSYFHNNVLAYISGLVMGAGNFVQHPLIVNLIGLGSYQSVVSLVAIAGLFLLPSQILSTVMIKYAASLSGLNDLGQLNTLLRRFTIAMLGLGGLFTLGFIVASPLIAAYLHLANVVPVIIVAVGFIVSFAGTVNGAVLQGLQRFSWSTFLTVIGLTLRYSFIVFFVFIGMRTNGILLAFTVSSILAYFISFLPLRSLLRGPRSPLVSLRPILSYSWITMVSAIGNTLMFQTDIIFASHYLSKTNAGLYVTVATLAKLALFISSALTAALFPRVASQHERGDNNAKTVLITLAVMTSMSFCVELFFIVLPNPILRNLYHSFNSTQVAAAATLLPWYGFAMLLFVPTQVLMTYFLATSAKLFAYVALTCSALQAILIIVRHASMAEILQAVTLSIAFMLVSLIVLFIARIRKVTKQISGSAKNLEGAPVLA